MSMSEEIPPLEPERKPENEKKEGGSPIAVVGIGASAGGLEALEQFFRHMPAENGMAFVVIQHQDPDQPSFLPEILQRYTEMPVVEIGEGGAQARQNTVYVKPPGFDLSIIKGRFTLLEPGMTFGAKTAIDIFFRHLAEDQDGKAVGVILSGMGSDGSLGIRALKEHTGVVMAQEPASSRFDAMPQSAIATGLVDYIAPPEDLPQLLADYINASSHLRERVAVAPVPEDALAKIFVLVRSRTGQDFSLYKKSTILRRIERRMGLHQLTRMEDYTRYLQENPSEIEILARELLIGVTRFFRDPEAWQAIRKKALPEMIGSSPEGGMLRVWVVGCSTGEEAYTMAMVLQECLEALDRRNEVRFQIFATDTSREAIDVARTGRYPANIEADVSPDRLDRFFVKENGTYQVRQQLRETIVFAPQNVIKDPPFTHLNIISCRNLLIYLSSELQKKLIHLFHFALDPGGILFLGSAESVGGYSDLFGSLDGTWKIFRRKDVPSSLLGHREMPAVFDAPSSREIRSPQPTAAKGPSITAIAQERLLDRYAPPAVIVTESGDIVYFHGKTGKYLEPPTGKANLNVSAMAREGLRYSLASALRKAALEKGDVAENVFVQADGGSARVRLTVQPLPRRPGLPNLFMAVFEDLQEPCPEPIPTAEPVGEVPADIRFAELERELAETREQLHHTAEEMQSSQEEMISMNEEFQSANEELQSTNEELTTSREELQSLNEELLTVNAELQFKIGALSESRDDMQNAVKSTEIPLLFLNGDLKVRRFTDAVKPIINLIENDIGRSVTDLKVNLLEGDFVKDVQEVLDTLQLKEKQVKTTDGRWFQMRIMPYRTSQNRIDGVVATFSDITDTKDLEISLRDARNYAENIVETVREPLVVLDSDLKVVSANRSFYKAFHVKPEETEGRLLYNLGNNQWDITQLRNLLEDVLPKNTVFEDYEVRHDFPGIGHRVMRLNARKVQSDGGSELILLAIEDVTDSSRACEPS